MRLQKPDALAVGGLPSRTWDRNQAKMEQKYGPNWSKNAWKFDVMLRTPKDESEQTLPHFCSFLVFRRLQKSCQHRCQSGIHVRRRHPSAKNQGFLAQDVEKAVFGPIFGRQLGPRKATRWQLFWAVLRAWPLTREKAENHTFILSLRATVGGGSLAKARETPCKGQCENNPLRQRKRGGF